MMNKNTYPKVSVIIPVYNREKTILQAIYSVFDQDYTNWELIIVDDCSSDNTVKVIQKYWSDNANVMIIKNVKNLGVAGSRNKGISHAKGEYIAFLDSDDIWVDTHLSSSIKSIQDANVKLSYSFWFRNVNGTITSVKDRKGLVEKLNLFSLTGKNKNSENYYFFDKDFTYFALTESVYCFHICTLVAHKSVFQKCGVFNTSLKCNEDIELSYRILMKNSFVLVKNEGFIYSIITGADSLYSFIDRKNIELDTLMNNKVFLGKVYLNVKYKISFYKILKKNIAKNYSGDKKEKSLKAIKDNISKRILTLAVLSLGYKKANPYLLFCLLIKKYRKELLSVFSINKLCIK